jgi:hypothetical protein
VVITGLLDSPSGGAPQLENAAQWRQNYGHVNSYTVIDPYFSMVSGGSVGTPQMTVINPRTMEVTYVQQGYSGSYTQLLNVARQNRDLEAAGL